MRQDTGQFSDHSKRALRRDLRTKRSKLSEKLRTGHNQAIGQYVGRLVKSHGARSVACYWPFDGEPDITPLCRELMTDACELALPVISGDDNRGMDFYSWRIDTVLGKNRYGISEPKNTASIPLSGLEIVLIPLVGYDRFGNRLGMGAGYYDRYLQPTRASSTPLRVGIAYSLQEIDPFVKNKWDIPLHGVVNEHGWFTFVGEDPITNTEED